MKTKIILTLLATSMAPGAMRAHINEFPEGFATNFVHAMRTSPLFTPELVKNDTMWHTVKYVYDKHIAHYTTEPAEGASAIPKIIHQIWLGEGEVPAEIAELHQSWQKHHPDWTYKLWTREDILQLPFNDIERFKSLSDVEKSYVARYAILYLCGGVFANSCCECLKSFNILNECCDFYAGVAGVSSENQCLLSDSIIACKANSSVIAQCFQLLCADEQIKDIRERSVFALTHAFRYHLLLSSDRIVALPLSYLDPWPRTNDNKPDINKRVKTQHSFAKKHWDILMDEKHKQNLCEQVVCLCPEAVSQPEQKN